MGNTIKYLKLRISQIPPDMSDSDVSVQNSFLILNSNPFDVFSCAGQEAAV